jgi:hypothetical protein
MITVVSVSKSSFTAATAKTYLVTDEYHSYDEILDTGLKAMNEDRSSLFGYGIENERVRFQNGTDYGPLAAGHYVVYAYRD